MIWYNKLKWVVIWWKFFYLTLIKIEKQTTKHISLHGSWLINLTKELLKEIPKLKSRTLPALRWTNKLWHASYKTNNLYNSFLVFCCRSESLLTRDNNHFFFVSWRIICLTLFSFEFTRPIIFPLLTTSVCHDNNVTSYIKIKVM